MVRWLSVLALVILITAGAGALPTMGGGVWAATGADLSSSTKAVDRTVASTGDVLTYQIVLRNTGTPTFVLLTDPIPALTTYVAGSVTGGAAYRPDTKEIIWAGLVTSGSPVTVTFQVTVGHEGTLGWPPVTNVATIEDLLTGESVDRTATTRIRRPDLSPSTKQVDKTLALDGDRLRYTIVLANEGVVDAPSVLLTDTVPLNTVYVTGSGSASKGSFVGTMGLMWTGPISVGERVTVTFDVTITAGTLGWPIKNVAYIDDGMGAVITRSATTLVNQPDLSPSTKNVDRHYARYGERLRYTIVLNNGGLADAPGALLTDTLPLNTSFVPGSGTASKGSFSVGTLGPIWTGSISVGEYVTITFDVTVTAGTLGTLLWPVTNVAHIDDGTGTVTTRSATTVVNPLRTLLPFIRNVMPIMPGGQGGRVN